MARILVIGKFYAPFSGGIEQNTQSVCEALAETHDVTALVFNHRKGAETETINRVLVIRRRVWASFFSQPVTFGYFRNVKLGDYDLLHLHAPNPLAVTLVYLRLLMAARQPKIIITHHMEVYGRPLLNWLPVRIYRLLARRADIVLVTSLRNYQASRDLPSGLECVAVPLGIEPSHFAPSVAEREVAREWRRGLVGENPVVAFVGRHARYKGLNVLISSLAQLPGVHAFIGGEGPYTGSAKELAKRLGILHRIHFLGWLSHAEKVRLLAAADIFAFPSTEQTEAFGVAQLEAMAVGTPVVASNLQTGVADVSVDRDTALTFRVNDVEDLRCRITELLADTILSDRISANAYQAVMSKFSTKSVVALTVGVFNKVLSS